MCGMRNGVAGVNLCIFVCVCVFFVRVCVNARDTRERVCRMHNV